MLHQFLRADRLDHLAPARALQEPEHDAFARRSSPPFSFAPSPELGFIPFDLSLQSARFQFCDMIQRFAPPVIDTGDDFYVQPQVLTQPIGRLPSREALPDPNCPAQQPKALAFPTAAIFHIASSGMKHLKGATENALTAPQKVGRTTKNRRSSRNHACFLPHIGYETP